MHDLIFMDSRRRALLTSRLWIAIAIAMVVLGLGIIITQVLTMMPEDLSEVRVEPSRSVAEPVTNAQTDTQEVRSLQDRIRWEEERLESLRTALSEVSVQQASAEYIRDQVQAVSARLEELEQQIEEREAEKATIDQDEQVFQREEIINSNLDKMAIENQIQALSATLAGLQTQLVQAQALQPEALQPEALQPEALAGGVTNQRVLDLQAQIAAVEMQRAQLFSDLRARDLASENISIQTAQAADDLKQEVHTEQQNMRRQYYDLSAQLDYWRKQETSLGDETIRQERIQTLQSQIEQQENRLVELRAQLEFGG